MRKKAEPGKFDYLSLDLKTKVLELTAQTDENKLEGIRQGYPSDNFKAEAETVTTSELAGSQKFNSFSSLVDENLETAIRELQNLRVCGVDKPAKDVSLSTYLNKKWGFAYEFDKEKNLEKPTALYELMDIDPTYHSVENLFNTSDFPRDGARWLISEIYRDALYSGLRKKPIYSSLIRETMNVNKRRIIMPVIDMSSVVPYEIGEASDISLGSISMSEGDAHIRSYGIGFQMTDTVKKEANINFLQIMMADLGVKLGNAISNKAINVLINGNDGSGNSVKTVGVGTPGTITYRDWLRVLLRASLLGYGYSETLGKENILLSLLTLPEVQGYAGGTTKMNINVVTPMPTNQNFHPYLGISSEDQILMLDAMHALIKLDYEPLRIEGERIITKRMEIQVATISTGFSTLVNQARLMLDRSINFGVAGWNASFDASGPDLENFRTL